MVDVIIIGAAGKMGRTLVRCCRAVREMRLVAAVEGRDCPHIGEDAGLLAGAGRIGVEVADDLAAVVAKGDVLIDFSFHSAVSATADLAARTGKALIVGTTGLAKDEEKAIVRAARKVPVVYAPNMSLGVNLLFSLVKQAASALGVGYDAEIVETHHKLKKDAPSGTALKLGERIAEARGQDFSSVAASGRPGQTGGRHGGEIGIHSLRAGDVIGDHTVTFAGDGERIELTHRATSREAFAWGALRAAAWIVGRRPKLYDMQDVLGLKND